MFLPCSSLDGSMDTSRPRTMSPISTNVPPLLSMSIPSASNSALPTNSITTSAPRPSVSSLTRRRRVSGVLNSSMFMVWSAPNASANSKRFSNRSSTITRSAPISLAMAVAWIPRPPAPCITT